MSFLDFTSEHFIDSHFTELTLNTSQNKFVSLQGGLINMELLFLTNLTCQKVLECFSPQIWADEEDNCPAAADVSSVRCECYSCSSLTCVFILQVNKGIRFWINLVHYAGLLWFNAPPSWELTRDKINWWAPTPSSLTVSQNPALPITYMHILSSCVVSIISRDNNWVSLNYDGVSADFCVTSFILFLTT